MNSKDISTIHVSLVDADPRDDCTTGVITPPQGRSAEDTDLDAHGQPLEEVRLPVYEDPDEWNRAADAALARVGWQRISEWRDEPGDAVSAELRGLGR